MRTSEEKKDPSLPFGYIQTRLKLNTSCIIFDQNPNTREQVKKKRPELSNFPLAYMMC